MGIRSYFRNVVKICRLAKFRVKTLLAVIAGMTFLSLLTAVLDSFGITLIFPAIFAGSAESSLFESVPLLGKLIDFKRIPAAQILSLAALFFLLKIVIDFFILIINDFLARELRGKLQTQFTANVLRRPLLAIEKLRTGDISSRIIADAPAAVSYVREGTIIISKTLSLLGYLVILFMISPLISFVLIGLGLVLGYFLKKFFHKIMIIGRQANDLRDQNNRHLVERINQIRLVKTLGMEHEEVEHFKLWYQVWNKVTFKRAVFMAISKQFMNAALFVATLILAVAAWINQGILAAMVLVLAPAFMIFQRLAAILGELSNMFAGIKRDEPSVELIFRDYDLKFSDADLKDTGKRFLSLLETITLKDVEFSYDQQPLIQGLNLELKVGSSALVRGASGGGKTTLANLLRAIIPVDKGQILFNGKPVAEYSSESLKEAIGYVTQESFIFHGSLRQNLLYGNKPQTSDQEIWQALEFCGIKDFVSQLPGQLDYEVTERGSVLSGGQKQRLNLARALIKKPSFLILDEITNNLDDLSREKIKETVLRLLKEKICFIISHDRDFNFSVVSQYELKQGRLVKIS